MKRLLVIVTVVLLGACADQRVASPVEENSLARSVSPRQTQQWCDTHPAECPGATPDPSPNAPGLYLGSAFTEDNCLDGTVSPGGDVDLDSLGDECERVIALSFAPELFYSSADLDMGRESYWAAKPDTWYDGVAWRSGVTVFYAIAYYRDGGSPTAVCQGTPVNAACLGHLGDSEAIELFITYDAPNHHWQLNKANYTRHGAIYSHTPSILQFPQKSLGYPRSYVSIGKHANYATDSECDAGGLAGTDTCSSNTAARVSVLAQRNLGSSSHRRVNCVGSEESLSLQQLGYLECFWTATYFTGWSGDNSGSVAGYAGQMFGY